MGLLVGVTKPNSYVEKRAWADRYTEPVKAIIKSNAMHIVSVSIAPNDADMKNATDMTIMVTGGCIAVRVRSDKRRERDFTIRSRVISGRKTELEKLREGFADWYLYAWTQGEKISEWILIDLNRVREAGLLDRERHEFDNHDGSGFIAISQIELRLNNCITASMIQ